MMANIMYERRTEWAEPVHRVELTVSLEILAQLTNPKVLVLGSTDAAIAQRIKYAGETLQTVNYDRFGSVFGSHIVQDSELVAFAVYKQMTESRKEVPFPLHQQPETQVSSMATDLVRLTSRRLVTLRTVLLFLLVAVLISVVDQWLQPVWAVIPLGSACRMVTHKILKLWLLG